MLPTVSDMIGYEYPGTELAWGILRVAALDRGKPESTRGSSRWEIVAPLRGL